jgi:hypothetical protein
MPGRHDGNAFAVIPACPESFPKKDSRRASLAGMTSCSEALYFRDEY